MDEGKRGDGNDRDEEDMDEVESSVAARILGVMIVIFGLIFSS